MRNTLSGLPVQTMDLLTVEDIKRAWSLSEPIRFTDPTLANTQLCLRATFFPLGFPVTISSNSQEVLEAAAESWSDFHKLFDVKPIQINIGVTDGGHSRRPPTPVWRMREYVASNTERRLFLSHTADRLLESE